MAGGPLIRRAGQCCSSTRGRVTARPRAGVAERAAQMGSRPSSSPPGQDLAALAREALRLADDLGHEHRHPAVVLVSNNPYALD